MILTTFSFNTDARTIEMDPERKKLVQAVAAVSVGFDAIYYLFAGRSSTLGLIPSIALYLFWLVAMTLMTAYARLVW